jgi:hypothetical protein
VYTLFYTVDLHTKDKRGLFVCNISVLKTVSTPPVPYTPPPQCTSNGGQHLLAVKFLSTAEAGDSESTVATVGKTAMLFSELFPSD